MLLLLLAATLFITPPRSVLAPNGLGTVFKSSEDYDSLSTPQQQCVTGLFAPPFDSPCSDKDCFCKDPQFISDHLEDCLQLQDRSTDGAFSAGNYNVIMGFYGNECGFQPIVKAHVTEKVTYTSAVPTFSPKTESSTAAGGDSKPTGAASQSGSGGGGSGGGSSQSSDLSLGGIIGIVAGICTIIGTGMAIYVCMKRRH